MRKILISVCLFIGGVCPQLSAVDTHWDLYSWSPSDYPPFSVTRFNSNGVIKWDPTADDDGARDGLWTSDNKLLVVGWGSNASFCDQYLARFWPDGSLDTNFGGDGIVVTAFSSLSLIHGVVEDSSGRYVTVGRRRIGTNNNFIVSRYRTNGTLDTSFGVAGHREIDFGTAQPDSGRDIAIDAAGRIVVAGFTHSPGGWDFAVARLTSMGALDTHFNTTGRVITDFPFAHDDDAYAVYTDPNNKIWVVGRATREDALGHDEDFAMVRYSTNGTVDTMIMTDTFGPLVSSRNNGRAWGVHADGNGRVIAAGRAFDTGLNEWYMAFVRYLSSGAFDTAFALNTDGGLLARDVRVDRGNGAYVTGGRVWDGTDWNMMLARVTSNGIGDGTFGISGIMTFPVSTGDEDGLRVINTDVQLYLVGWSVNAGAKDFTILRFDSNGALAFSGKNDLHFAGAGEIAIDLQGDIDVGSAMLMDAQGGIYLAGTSENGNAATRQSAIIHVHSNGTLDTFFSGDGIGLYNVSAADQDQLQAIMMDNTTRLIAAGWLENGGGGTRNASMIRVRSNGALDTHFSGDGVATFDLTGDADRDELYAVATNGAGRIFGAGVIELSDQASREMVVIRVHTNGSLDTAFGIAGVAMTSFAGESYAYNMAFDHNTGRLYVAGFSEVGGTANGTRDFAVARFNTNGALDTSFSSDGMVTFDISGAGNRDEATFIMFDTLGGRLWLAGFADTGDNDGVIVRMRTNGTLDTSFSTDGIVYYDRGGNGQWFYQLMFQSNGKIVAIGEDQNDALIARFLTDGSLDTSFATAGARRESIAGADVFYGGAILPDGRIAIGGSAANDFGILRVWP